MKKTLIGVLALALMGIILWQLNPTTTTEMENGRSRNPQSTNIQNQPDDDTNQQAFTVSEPVTPVLSPALRDLPVSAFDPPLDREINPRQNPLLLDGVQENIVGPPDPLLYSIENQTNTPAPIQNFDGMGNILGASPPDTVGAVGPNHYVQMINVNIAVYNKTGTLLSGPSDIDALWSGQGGNCDPNTAGDPIVLYDQLADRWLVSQFAGPSHMCVAISQTADPTGAYHLYEFNVGSFPDYFKFGVWPDGYYMSANENSYTAYAFDRSQMLAGNAATFQKFTGQTNLLLPSDIDGATLPPVGAPNYFYTFKDNSSHGGADRIEVFAFDVDWVTPGNSTFTLANTIPISAFTYSVCGFFNFNCIPQNGTTRKLDAISEWPMFRLQYRNFGTHETLVSNFTVDVGSDRAGIRWFELHKTGANWTLYQEGTHAPDNNHYWLGSAALDQAGNMALAYSVSSSSMYPAIRYATRLSSDPLGTMQSEATLINGGGSQTGNNRWGDYSALTVDPVDECTFWFTSEYYSSTSSSGWKTRIGSFKIPGCGCSAPTAVTDLGATLNANGADIDLTWSDTGADYYEIYRKSNDFYFAPSVGTLITSINGTAYTDTDPNIIGDVDNNYGYVSVSVNDCAPPGVEQGGTGIPSDPSNRVGEFDFELVPGTP